jgi:glycosyltransferase involved in cell wall biosynthesis
MVHQTDQPNHPFDGESPLVSVIIPAFNAASFVEQTLASVFEQTYPAIEIIVVDDGSTDETPDILRRHEDRITLLTQENAGQAAARNRGAKIARGGLFCFLDADDVFDREKIAQQVRLLDRFAEAVAVYCDYRTIDDAGNITQDQNALHTVHPSGDVLKSFLRDNNIITPGQVLMRRSAWLKTGGYSEAPIHRGHEDGAFWPRLALEGPLVYSPETLLSYRRHNAQETQRDDYRLTMSRSRVARLEEVKEAVHARGDLDLNRFFDRQIFDAQLNAAHLSRRHGDWGKAVRYARSAINTRPVSLAAWRALLSALRPPPTSPMSIGSAESREPDRPRRL